MVLFLHNRYRTTGGEERVVEDLLALVREQLGESAQLMTRDSATLRSGRAALGLLRGGLDSDEVAQAVRAAGARVVHAHNLQPMLGWRALAAARQAGARVVLHLHQYRLVCAVGVCFTRDQECTRCHGRNTSPGILRNCRGSRSEALTYGAALALWQRRLIEQADAMIVPSRFALERLRGLGAPLPWERIHVLPPPVLLHTPPAATAGEHERDYALVVSRLSPEKGVDVAIDACRMAGMPLVIAGDGPQLPRLRELAAGARVRFEGQVGDAQLASLRAGASIALAPSRSAETFGMAVAESMAAGLPVVASRVGAIPELLEGQALVAPGDAAALADAITRLAGDRAAGERGRARVRKLCAPAVVAQALAAIYDGREGAGDPA